MAKVHPDPEVRVAASEAEERLDKWATDLAFRRPVYEALIAYADSDRGRRARRHQPPAARPLAA